MTRRIYLFAAVLAVMALLVALTTPSVMDELAHRAIDVGVIP